jgi:hypothetical protein
VAIRRLPGALFIAAAFALSSCSNSPGAAPAKTIAKATAGDLYTCAAVGYWDHDVLAGQVPAPEESAALQKILRPSGSHLNKVLSTEIAKAKSDYAAGLQTTTGKDIANMTATCEQWPSSLGSPINQH